jgi:hypothetical protein
MDYAQDRSASALFRVIFAGLMHVTEMRRKESDMALCFTQGS